MPHHEITITVEAKHDLKRADARRLVRKLLDVGLSNAAENVELACADECDELACDVNLSLEG